MTYIADTAQVSPSATIGENTFVWHFTQIRENVEIGANCIIGKGAYIDSEVKIGSEVKIQNGAQIFSPARIGSGVFIGPCVVLTNDLYPRSVDLDGTLKSDSDWTKQGVEVLDGASIGAGCVCVAPIVVGKWSMIGAGSVVTRDTKTNGLYVGNPARRIGWVGKTGKKLEQVSTGDFVCPDTGEIYFESDGALHKSEKS